MLKTTSLTQGQAGLTKVIMQEPGRELLYSTAMRASYLPLLQPSSPDICPAFVVLLPVNCIMLRCCCMCGHQPVLLLVS